jgi:hypothetical protein
MNSRLSSTQAQLTIEQRINAMPVNAAHRRAALGHYRAAMAAADRAVELTRRMLSLARTMRAMLGGFKRRIDSRSM